MVTTGKLRVAKADHASGPEGGTRRYRDPMFAETAIKVGEAGCALDPLSSQGVQAAMMSGFQAGIVVHTIRAYPDDAACARAYYRDAQREAFDRHRRTVAALYAAPTRFAHEPFWQARAAGVARRPAGDVPAVRPDQPLRLATEAQIKPTPVVDHDRIRLHDALHHPALERPIAFLDGIALAPLLRGIDGDAHAVLAGWAPRIAPQQGRRILSWLAERRILVPAG